MCVTNLIKRSSLWYNTRKQDATCSAIERISSDGNRFCSCSMLYEGEQKKNCMTWATHTWRYWINKYGGEDKWTEGRPHPDAGGCNPPCCDESLHLNGSRSAGNGAVSSLPPVVISVESGRQFQVGWMGWYLPAVSSFVVIRFNW